MEHKTLVTGASGFIGRRVVEALVGRGERPLVLLHRSTTLPPNPDAVEVIHGDIGRPESFASRISGVGLVVHLAGATGRASRAAHRAVNADGTARLLRLCEDEGVGRFLLVSSIATKFDHGGTYPYAEAKAAAEAALRESRVPGLIVRPTAVLGVGSPVLAGLVRLATLPVVVVFGDGRARIQPIHVDDLADGLVTAASALPFDNAVVEMGGPEVVTIEELLLTVREVWGRTGRRTIHLPLRVTQTVLSALEPVAGRMLPVTAGQLSAFRFDGIAERHAFVDGLTPRVSSIREMLRASRREA